MTEYYELAPHETLEVHELLGFKNICITKTSTMKSLVSDPELKSLMEQDVQTTKKQIKDLQGILS